MKRIFGKLKQFLEIYNNFRKIMTIFGKSYQFSENHIKPALYNELDILVSIV